MIFSQSEYENEVFKNITATSLNSIEFDNCVFKNCIFNETTIEFCKFIDCVFEESDLSLVKIKSSTFIDISIKDSKAIGVNWALSQLPFSANFYSSNISMSSFYQLDLRNSEIVSCKSHEVDYAHTNLEKVNFKDTDLLNATFNNTNLKNTDLSLAINYLIDPKYNTIKATKVSLPEATSFLKFLDLKIID